jgi:hypothetical protein
MGQGRSIPSNASEATRRQMAKDRTLEIKYITMEEYQRGDFKTYSIEFAYLNPDEILGEAEELRQHAKHHDITIVINLGEDFRSTGKMAGISEDPELEDILADTHIDALRVRGRFSADYGEREKKAWWSELVFTINHLGLSFREDAEIVFAPMSLEGYSRQGFNFVKRNTE